MATTKLFCGLRRSHVHRYFLLSSQFQYILTGSVNGNFQSPLSNRAPSPSPSNFNQTLDVTPWLGTALFRHFSSRSSSSDFLSHAHGHSMNLVTESELRNLGFDDGMQAAVAADAGNVEDPILPISAVISLLDGYHDLAGLPWWIIIASSTLALRLGLLPLLILQLHKMKRIGKLFPKLPPPFPPPFSGRGFINQFSLFQRERKAIGCPSYLWFLASFTVQVPCFFLWMASIRKMSLDHHPGFDVGGILWFQNLTEYPHGVLGPIFPILIAGLHFFNVQISFRSSTVGKETGLFSLLAKYYKYYLNLLTFPLFFIGFCVPQGSLVYWVTNSSLTLIQQLSLQHPAIRAKLGLPNKEALREAPIPKRPILESRLSDIPSSKKISVHNLSPIELLNLSIQFLAEGNKDGAIPILRLAIDKDPEYVRALIVMGQVLLQKGLEAEATEFLERAISKIFLVDQRTDIEGVDNLILASQWAGAACIRQGKNAEGLVHLERVASMEEPEDSKIKAHYYDGLLLYASALYNEGQKAEAIKYLRMAVAYDPKYTAYLEQCEKEEDEIVDDLVSSRRSDY
ncbi:hypothetical protein Nepgr_012203 [Nepenthes gracilis]|uniref:ALBINO3-like protein 2, chloroplastic n=1 Tax=Nepenthes gracilis TaxID=150966 RepID=A0AAD3XML7_NEPGR|nr:hypothetical protein Nepgr_012203 [Nepenthes gracilis]